MAEETKLTLKLGVMLSLVSAVIVFMLSALWAHQTDITILKTNQQMVMQALVDLKTIPVKLTEMQYTVQSVDRNLKDHIFKDKK